MAALGDGHGLSATLSALRFLTDDVTAIVTVADNGGSSGRLRREFGVLPPGDLRMALAALCDDSEWGLTWRDVLQHRFGGNGPLAGHAVGNLLILALWEIYEDPVSGLELVASLLRAEIAAIRAADWVVLGPGSWFTSVMPHLLVPEVRDALAVTRAGRLLSLNLEMHTAETAGFSAVQHVETFITHAPDVRLDVVLADPRAIGDTDPLERICQSVGARLHLSDLAQRATPTVHDPLRYAAALQDVLLAPRGGTDAVAG